MEEPVHVDDQGFVIDGDARVRLADELGITSYTVIVHRGLTEEDKRELSLRLNCNRRHLTTQQRTALLEREIKRNPDRSTRLLGDLCGLSRQTVHNYKKELEARGEIEPSDRLVGRDGALQPACKPRKPTVIIKAAEEVTETLRNVRYLETAELSGRPHYPAEVKKIASAKRTRIANRERSQGAEEESPHDIDADAENRGDIDLIISNGRDADEEPIDYGKLVELAVRALKPGAFLAVTVPHGDLMRLCTAMDGKLDCVGRFAEILPLPAPAASSPPVEAIWELTLLFQRPEESQKQSVVTDLFPADGDEDGYRPLLGALIDAYTAVGDRVLNASASDDVRAVCSESGRECLVCADDVDGASGYDPSEGETGGPEGADMVLQSEAAL
jgi:ParB-like chromosome segregation protein Spo0J